MKEFLERTDSAGNQIYTTKTGEITMQNETLTTETVFPKVETIPDPKNNLIIAEMCFPKDQLMMMLNEACVTKEQVEEMIRQFDAQKTDIIFSSHQLAQVQRLAQYILFIDHGEIKEKGPVGPFFLNPQTQAAKRYLHQELLAD